MSELAGFGPPEEAPHDSCHEGGGCCEEPCGPVFRHEDQLEATEETSAETEKGQRKIIPRVGGSGYFYDVDRGISDPFLFKFRPTNGEEE